MGDTMIRLTKVLKQCIEVLSQEGMAAFFTKAYGYLNRNGAYGLWIKNMERIELEREKMPYCPLISVIVPVYNVHRNMLEACIQSVLQQTYDNFELCLVDDCSTWREVKEVLALYESREKVKIVYREENGHISRATNTGFDMASGEFVGLLDCDDTLAPNALYEMVRLLNQNPKLDYIYSDEDKITEDGKKRKDPFFKPDWSPDTLMSLMYTSHFSLYRKSIVLKAGGMRVGAEGAQDYDLTLRVTECTDAIGHIPKVLYHWRERKESTAYSVSSKSYIQENTKKVKLDALERRGQAGELEYVPELAQYRVVYQVMGKPLVSIIILSKDNSHMFEQCVKSIFNNTTYENYEVLLVDNGSGEREREEYNNIVKKYKIRYIYEKMPFNFSKMCNIGAWNAKGEFLLFLNDDIEILQKDWLQRMLGHAQLKHIGAVGAKLYYPDSNRIQHAGILNLKTGPCHAFYQMKDQTGMYYGRNIMDYNYSCVTGACFLVQKEKFLEAGKFDESFPVAYNDVALCFALLREGYYNVIRTDVTMFHHESVSRGYDEDAEKEKRLKKEMEHLYQKFPEYKGYDPCYNLNLVQTRGDFSI